MRQCLRRTRPCQTGYRRIFLLPKRTALGRADCLSALPLARPSAGYIPRHLFSLFFVQGVWMEHKRAFLLFLLPRAKKDTLVRLSSWKRQGKKKIKCS